MKRATITIPDDLEGELERYVESQPTRPTLAAIVQAALRRFLAEEQLRAFDFRPARGRFRVRPADRGSGLADVAERHDAYLADDEDPR